MTARTLRDWRCPVCTLRHSPYCVLVDQRWPLGPLVTATGSRGALNVAATFGVSATQVRTAAEFGLSDQQADRWAVRAGLHPAQVWPDWCDAALTVVDAQRLAGGWRPAWEHADQPAMAEAVA